MVDIRCGSCGYPWDYTGKLYYATCPRCNGKVMTPLNSEHPDFDPDLLPDGDTKDKGEE